MSDRKVGMARLSRQSELRVTLIVATLFGSWLGMQAVHESGHVLGAALTGGKVKQVILYPLNFSRTDVEHNPHPLTVVWLGPLIGAAAPIALWVLASLVRLPGTFVLRFFAGFCLIANGLYIGIGSLVGVGDCGDLLRHGAAPWQLWLFGIATVPVGFCLWNGQGRHFGLGPQPDTVSPRITAVVVGVALALVVGGCLHG